MLDDIEMELYEDYGAIVLYAGDSTEWPYLSGWYTRLGGP
jgi:hypothetical protein